MSLHGEVYLVNDICQDKHLEITGGQIIKQTGAKNNTTDRKQHKWQKTTQMTDHFALHVSCN